MADSLGLRSMLNQWCLVRDAFDNFVEFSLRSMLNQWCLVLMSEEIDPNIMSQKYVKSMMFSTHLNQSSHHY